LDPMAPVGVVATIMMGSAFLVIERLPDQARYTRWLTPSAQAH
jgi:hypothetical protein